MDAPPNALTLAHRSADVVDDLPVLCVSPLGVQSPDLLITLLEAGVVTATYQACSGEHEGPCDTTPTEHPHIGVHLNPGPALGHANCMVLDMCAGCDQTALADVIATGGAVLQAHVRTGGGRTPRVRVRLVNAGESQGELALVRSRLIS